VGALTERDFRFKARVWYLSSSPTVCNGCSQGCNIEMHYLLDRPHLNDGARVVRIKPRYNPDVNQWWLCDEGRYGFTWIDQNRLDNVRGPSSVVGATWEQALVAISEALVAADTKHDGTRKTSRSRIGVIASSQLTNEELFLIREIFQTAKGAQVSASVPARPGFSDDFLIKADRSPNTLGAIMLGLAGPDVPPAAQIVDDGAAGHLDVLWVFGHDLVDLFGEDKVRKVAERVGLFVFSGTNQNATVPFAHWVLPSAAYVEKDGTFVNCHGRVQRIGRTFPPFENAREDWRLLLELARNLGQPVEWRGPADIFQALAQTVLPFHGLSYDNIGTMGVQVATARPAQPLTTN
jgi:NADH-quinone oxidoreductase subunit G